jgi:uracil-DNA glycosylase
MAQSRPAFIGMSKPDLSLALELEASLAWWRAAGVDCDFTDDATAWLAEAPLATGLATTANAQATPPQEQPRNTAAQRNAPPSAAAPATVTPRRNLLGDSPPGDLSSFRQWWSDQLELGGTGLYPRIAPRGAQGAALMVLVPQPEEHDRERLMEGPQGRLLANILAAMGFDDNAVYLASALPCHMPMADLAALAAGGMDTVLAHHVALVRPQRVLALGTGLGPWLSTINDAPLREINQTMVNTPVMVSETLDALMEMPRLKARLWKRWIEWSAG